MRGKPLRQLAEFNESVAARRFQTRPLAEYARGSGRVGQILPFLRSEAEQKGDAERSDAGGSYNHTTTTPKNFATRIERNRESP